MSKLFLKWFGGMKPRRGDQHLDERRLAETGIFRGVQANPDFEVNAGVHATEAENCNLYSGELRPLHKPALAYQFCKPGDPCFRAPIPDDPSVPPPPPPPEPPLCVPVRVLFNPPFCKQYECDAVTNAFLSLGTDHTYAFITADPNGDPAVYLASLEAQYDLTGSGIDGVIDFGNTGQGDAQDVVAIDTCNNGRALGSGADTYEGFTAWRLTANVLTHQQHRHNQNAICAMRYTGYSNSFVEGEGFPIWQRNNDNGSQTGIELNPTTGKLRYLYHNTGRSPIWTEIGDAPIYNGDPNNEEWFVLIYNTSNDGNTGPVTMDYTIKMIATGVTYTGSLLTAAVYRDALADEPVGTDIGGNYGLFCEPGTRQTYPYVSLGFGLSIGSYIPASAADTIIAAWEQNKSTYVDPNPNCIQPTCKQYECDALPNYIKTQNPRLLYIMDQGNAGGTATIRSDGAMNWPLTSINNAGQNPEAAVPATFTLDPCGDYLWYSGGGPGTYVFQDQSLAGGPPAETFIAASKSVTIGGFTNSAPTGNGQNRYGFFLVTDQSQQGLYHYLQQHFPLGPQILTAAWCNGFMSVDFDMDALLTPTELSQDLFHVVTMDYSTDGGTATCVFRWYVNGVFKAELTDTTTDQRAPYEYYFVYNDLGTAMYHYCDFFDDYAWSEAQLAGLAEAFAQNSATYVDPNPNCVPP